MLGQVHGTREMPEFLDRLVCSIAGSNRPVVLALEYPGSESRPAIPALTMAWLTMLRHMRDFHLA